MRGKKLVYNLLALAAAAVLVVLTILTPGQAAEEYTPGVYATVPSLLPPVIAIALALITKEVYSSLFVGVAAGALLYAGGNGELALNTLLFHEDAGLVSGIANSSHACILVFVTLLGTLVVLMNRSGGAAAFGRWAQKRIKTRMGAQLLTIVMGLLIFVDDGFNCMTVGSVMRPITDGHQVSRAKLAYLLDSTAAPVCIIAPISCWAAAVSYAVPEGMEINGFHMFIRTIPYNLYALATLVMLLLLVLLKLDYGPMRLHEANARKGDLFTAGDQPYEEAEEAPQENGRISDLVIPVAVLIFTCLLGMVYTGGLFRGAGLIDAFADADSARGLVMGSLVTVIVTFWLYMDRGVLSFKDFMGCFAAGFRSMCAPMIILILSWNLSGVTGLLGAADFIHGLMASSAEAVQMLIPAIAFVVSVFLAFSTGTSWGTFTILIPIVCAVFPGESEMLVISIAACLAGAVCGDHCSPISDTTIMSSAGAKSNHINHVTTQLPYALTAAAVCVPGYILAGIIGSRTNSSAAALAAPVTLGILLAVLLIIRRREGRREEE
ncbi:MAG: Na+/H+ antiporter NhaC family protein [Oscillospiraceae bacterium]|nr:Na+/H+ antiporter NhaC family protein [Oscillospiraceae bacterium]